MFKIHPEIPESLSLEAKSFILRCFEPDPQKRAIASDLLRDTFVRHNTKGKKSKIAFKPPGQHTNTHMKTQFEYVNNNIMLSVDFSDLALQEILR